MDQAPGPRLRHLTDAGAVRAAMADFDAVGRDTFLEHHGFGRAKEYFLVHDGREYDSKAIAGVALAHQPGVERALSSAEFHGGASDTARHLRRLGFTVEHRPRG